MKTAIKGFALIVTLCLCGDLSAQAYKSAVGARLGTSFTGSYKMFISETNALEGIVGLDRTSLGIPGFSSTSLVLGAFYQIHKPLDLDGVGFTWYYGFGGFAYIGDFSGIVPSGIIGLEYTLEDSPVNFFIDASPGLYIGDGGSDFDITGFIGARYILNR